MGLKCTVQSAKLRKREHVIFELDSKSLIGDFIAKDQFGSWVKEILVLQSSWSRSTNFFFPTIWQIVLCKFVWEVIWPVWIRLILISIFVLCFCFLFCFYMVLLLVLFCFSKDLCTLALLDSVHLHNYYYLLKMMRGKKEKRKKKKKGQEEQLQGQKAKRKLFPLSS